MNDTQLEQLVALHGKDILRFCRITTGSTEAGDELYQDTMLTLLEKRDILQADQNAKAYAVSVALRLWSNRKRKFARRLRLAPQESLEALAEQGIQPGSVSSPEETLIRTELTLQVRRLVQQLPDKYRLPLQLYYSAGLTVTAIGQVLQLPENTVKSRLRRAKAIIRTKLEENHESAAI